MATTYVADGDRIPYTCAAAVTAGQIVVLTAGTTGSAGVAVESGVTGDVIPVAVAGVWTVTKKAGATLDFAVGERAFTTATGAVTPTATGNTGIGYAYAAAVTGATTAQIRLVQAGSLA